MNNISLNSEKKYECPLCGEVSSNVLQVFDCKQAAAHVCANRSDGERFMLEKHIKKLWGNGSCSFLKCGVCELAFAYPFVSGDSFFYTTVYDNTVGYQNWKWEFEITRERLRGIVEQQSGEKLALLEIGAGNGSFVKKLLNGDFDQISICTTEYSEVGKAEIEKLGIKCLGNEIWEFSEESEEKNKFDFICMFQVLEHMDDFDRTFKSISALSNDGAHLFIAVPSNIHREYFEQLGFIEDVPPTHISRWNKESFMFAGEKYGWDMIEHSVEPNRLHTNIAKILTFKYKDHKRVKWVNSIQNQYLRKLSKLLIYTPFLLINIPIMLPMRNEALGVVQWVMFKKL